MSITLFDSPTEITMPEVEVTATRIAPTPAAAPTASNKKWLRAWNLSVGTSGPGLSENGQAVIGVSNTDAKTMTQGGSALDLSDFRITFDVEKIASRMPWRMTATVYNVPKELSQRIADQYTNVTLIAGYQLPQPKPDASKPLPSPSNEEIANMPPAATIPQGYKPGGSVLFTGDVVWYERGREGNGVDTFLRIYANSTDVAHNQTMINTTLPAGSTQKDVVKACVDAMAKDDPKIKLGVLTAGMEDVKAPRARTLYGMPREILRDVAQTVGGFVFISEDGKVNILKTTDDLPAPAGVSDPIIVLNEHTGMIGVPSQNMDGGMSVRMLLNPSVAPFTKVWLNNDEITRKTLSKTQVPGGGGLAPETQAVAFQQTMVDAAKDGIYRVWSVKHSGDNRGNPWYTDIITVSANPGSQAPKLG